MEQRWKKAARLELEPDSPLPERLGPELRFDWDWEAAGKEHWTVIRCGDVLVWRELAYFEGYARFDEVKAILKQRFGQRFAGLYPTRISEFDLYGDCWRHKVAPN